MDRWDGYAGYDELYHSDYYGMYDYYPEDELYHYGVKGQKWGVRRYQNADGSLTDTGRAHYGRGSGGGRRAGGYDEKKGVNWRKVAAVGAGVAGAAALGYGAYRFAGTPVGQKYGRRISTRAKLAGLKLQRGAERFQPTTEKYGRRISTRAKLAGLKLQRGAERFQPTMEKYGRRISTRAKLAGLKLQRGAERFQPTMEKYGRRISTRAKLAGLKLQRGAERFQPTTEKYGRRISTRAKLAGLKLQRGAERFQPTMEKYGRRISTRAKLAGLRVTNARDMARYNRKLKRVKI